MPIELPTKSEKPLTKDTILSVNQRRVQRPLSQQNITMINQSTGKQIQRNSNNGQSEHRAAPQYNAAPTNTSQKRFQSESQIKQYTVPRLHNPVRKGQKIPLENSGKLAQVKACIGWNVMNPDCEVDVSAFLLQGEKVPGDDWFVFYGQDRSPDNSVKFYAEAKPDREMITVDFSKLSSRVDKIVFILTINKALENKLNFSMLKDSYIRLLDAVTNQEIVSFEIDEYYSNVTSMMIGEIYKHNGLWKFNAVGNGVGRDLAGLCEMYGVQVE